MSSILEEGQRVLEVEANAILGLRERLDESFVSAVNLVLSCQGKLVLAGMGKSGQIAKKIASTFSSTGTPAVFLHPAESSHGDLGIINQGDLVIAISHGGESSELVDILNFLARKDIPLIGITGNVQSSLGRAGKVALDTSVKEEACPLGLAPTSSSTAALAMGDALAMAVLKEKGFRKEDFAEFHPGGKLGKKLLLRVKDIMHSGDALPRVEAGTPLKEVISQMTSHSVRGVVAVMSHQNELRGSITDGDIRRRLQKENFSLDEKAEALMSHSPKTIDLNELAEKALFIMEQFKIDRLFVVETLKSSENVQLVGLVHIQDLLAAGIR